MSGKFLLPSMRACFKIVLVLLCSSVFAIDAEISDGVWIDGNSFYKSIKHKKKSTIYFSDWSSYIDQFLSDEDYYVALQLNNDFDPLPHDKVKLPSLSTIAAVGDENLRSDYFRFLESFGRTYGINHMVLPDTTGFSVFEKEVIRQAHDHSPFYFLDKSNLS